MARRPFPTPPVTVYADSSTPAFFPATAFQDAAQITKLQCVYEALRRVGLCEVSAAYQTANDVDNPDAAVAIGSYRASNGIEYPTDWTTTSFGGKQYVRFGYLAKLTSGSTLGLFYAFGVFYVIEG